MTTKKSYNFVHFSALCALLLRCQRAPAAMTFYVYLVLCKYSTDYIGGESGIFIRAPQRYPFSRSTLRMLLVLWCILYLLSLTQGMQEDHSRLNTRPINFTGQFFHGFAYPTVEELSLLSLRDFAQLRPVKNAHKMEKEHFAYLFSLHPQVRSIDPLDMPKENFVEAWVDLWCCQSSSDPQAKKLPSCIKDYLSNDPRIGPDILIKVQRARQKIVDARAQLKCRRKSRLSEDPDIIRKGVLRAQRKYERARERISNTIEFREQMAEQFKNLLQRKDIVVSLSAKETEYSTRQLNDAIVDVRTTSLALRHFLQARENVADTAKDISEAVEERKAYNLAEKKARSNQRLLSLRKTLREERRRNDAVAKESTRKERLAKSVALMNQAAMDQVGAARNDNLSGQLLRESQWWRA